MVAKTIDELYLNIIRTFSMDGVPQANFGLPGTPMDVAPQRWPWAIRR
jgi:transketolase